METRSSVQRRLTSLVRGEILGSLCVLSAFSIGFVLHRTAPHPVTLLAGIAFALVPLQGALYWKIRERAIHAGNPLERRLIHFFRIARTGNWIVLSAGWAYWVITLVQTTDWLNLTYAFLLLMLGTLEQVNYYHVQLVRGDAYGGRLNRRFGRPSLAKAISRFGS